MTLRGHAFVHPHIHRLTYTTPRAILLAGLAVLMLQSLATTAQAKEQYKVKWLDCTHAVPAPLSQSGADTPSKLPTALKCGLVQLPIDWGKPLASDNSVDVGFALHAAPIQPAKGKKAPLLNYNPGGPALEVTSYAWARALKDPSAIIFTGLEAFDLLAIDVRGTFRSSALNCAADEILLPAAVPSNKEQFQKLSDIGRRIAKTCSKNAQKGNVARYSGAEEVARDWDAIREALGYDKMHIYAYSYGTLQAQVALRLYPNKIDRVVLDGVYAPGTSNKDLIANQVKATTRVLDRADAYCQRNSSCPLKSGGKGAVQKAFAQVLQSTDKSKPRVTVADVRSVTVNGYFATHPQYDNLFMAIAGASQGNWDGFEYKLVADPLSAYSPTTLPFLCRDIDVEDTSYEGYKRLADDAFSKTIDKYDLHFSQDIYLLGLCTRWPYATKPVKASRISPKKSKDVLILQSDYDMNTPIEGAFEAWENLPGSTMVIRHGDGHGSLMAQGAARDAAITFLASGETPKKYQGASYSVLPPPPGQKYTTPNAYDAPIDRQTTGAGIHGEGIKPPAKRNPAQEDRSKKSKDEQERASNADDDSAASNHRVPNVQQTLLTLASLALASMLSR